MSIIPNPYPRGSEWRRWDLHLHTPETLKEDQFAGNTPDEKWAAFCDTINDSSDDVAVVGVTDYLLIDNYKKFVSLIAAGKITKRFDLVLPNLELRLTPVTGAGSALNLHLLVDPAFVPQIDERIYSKLTLHQGNTNYAATRDGLIRLGKTINPKATDDVAYKEGARKFVIDFETLKRVFDADPDLWNHCITIVSNSSNDGASGITTHSAFFTGTSSDLDAKRQAVYKFAKAIFSANPNDRQYFLGKGVDDRLKVIAKCGSLKPCVHGCDAHTNAKVFKPDDDRLCWIKADPTFEGLKQILYEPEERVCIGPVQPDQKDAYKVIRRITFPGSTVFPAEIQFNDNLTSIIGSRSSGKSALLAYVAHAVDPGMAEDLLPGPGEGEQYHWNRVSLPHHVEWANGKSNDDSPGKVVFIKQNYLFEESKNPDVIKHKIEPVLFKTIAGAEAHYNQATLDIGAANQGIRESVGDWFEAADELKNLEAASKDLGDRKAVENSKKEIEEKIKTLKKKNSLSDDEVGRYQKLNQEDTRLTNRIKANDAVLLILAANPEGSFFSAARATLTPAFTNLANPLQDSLRKVLSEGEERILASANKTIVAYQQALTAESKSAQEALDGLHADPANQTLLAKYQGNLELGGLIQKVNQHDELLKSIDATAASIETQKARQATAIGAITGALSSRAAAIQSLLKTIETADQSALVGIRFGAEAGFDVGHEQVLRLNIRANTEFVKSDDIKLDEIRKRPADFLEAIYSGNQKVIARSSPMEVAADALTLTEKVLLTAEMENDKIGGFSEPTMTPGKRALFALRLILAESNDTWPLLIDQPEDDLDSRSIYDEVVPFLKEKKKERQIIMVSHNANLVIGADSEEVVVANRNGNDRKNQDGREFNYLTGSLEHSYEKDDACSDTLHAQGVCEHACEILDGGKLAFESRKNKYNIK
jgi:energy-coupling factor transporter ATP-binding protein EcfA2